MRCCGAGASVNSDMRILINLRIMTIVIYLYMFLPKG